MEYRHLGRSGLKVSLIGLGCNNLGRSVDQKTTNAIINTCLDLGVTLFDCADIYGGRLAEQFLGNAVRPRRSEAVVATKVGAPLAEGKERSASRGHIMTAVEQSLRRLDVGEIDLLQIHFPDPSTPVEETLRALDDLVRQGKVRYIGCCNFSAVDVVEAAWTAKTCNVTPFVSAQNRHNVLEKRISADMASACERHGLGFLPYYPLAAGLLTGKYKAGEPPPADSRLATPNRFYDGMLNDTNFARLGKLEKFAQQNDHSILELGIGWLASQPVISSVICGATKPEQVESNVRASTWRMTPAQMKEIDALVGL